MYCLQMILPVRRKHRITKGTFSVFLLLHFSDFRLGVLTYMAHSKFRSARLNRDKSFYHVEKLELQRRKEISKEEI